MRMTLHKDEWQNLKSAASRPIRRASDLRRRRVEAMVDAALASGRICMVHQPVHDARDPNVIAFSEGLMRLSMPGGTMVSPGTFLPIVAGSDRATRLDCAVLTMTLAALKARPDIRLSINVSAGSLLSPEWSHIVEAATERDPQLAHRLILEINENEDLLATAGIIETLRRMSGLGICLALDDFGGGTASFRQFRNLRFDMVKIDGGFGSVLESDADTRVLVKALVDVAKHFEMMSVAEGIETLAAAEVARDLGVDALQGRLLSLERKRFPNYGALPVSPSQAARADPASA